MLAQTTKLYSARLALDGTDTLRVGRKVTKYSKD